MSMSGEQILMRIYLQSADRAPRTPTYERLVKAARQHGLAGATVLKGIMGFGPRGLIEASAWSLVEHVPIIVEIVDSATRLVAFLDGPIRQHLAGGLVTLERASVLMYRPRQGIRPSLHLSGAIAPLSTVPEIQPGESMTIDKQGVLLRVFIGESDHFENVPLHEAIVRRARELGLAGATVLRGVEGFGANSVVHKAQLLEISSDLPLVIEIVDSEANIQRLLPHLEQMVQEGMITMEHVAILLYRDNNQDVPA